MVLTVFQGNKGVSDTLQGEFQRVSGEFMGFSEGFRGIRLASKFYDGNRAVF